MILDMCAQVDVDAIKENFECMRSKLLEVVYKFGLCLDVFGYRLTSMLSSQD